ncbi:MULTISPECIES: DUF4190 domain-containing protein [Microbacterium]|uniref:DUF4190 domain-containing protein n=1 Tax=Microbacterium TaxID=33882 RepID=UPI001C628F9A|nr:MULTISPECIES: DUF4190 domain-containing protein [Microbacterium]QYG11703.1 DUF4190 domain-containing protein [Microbacterium sp. PAMC22086]
MTNPPFPEPPAPDSSNPVTPPPTAPPAPPAAPPTGPPTWDAGPGAAPAYPQPEPSPPGRVLSIVGLVLAFVAAPIGLILSIVAAVKLGKAGQPKGLAIAGIVVGAVLTIVEIIGIILFIAFFAAIFGMCAELGTGVWEVNGVTYTCG